MSDEEDLFALQVQIGMLKKFVKAANAEMDNLSRQRLELTAGLRKAEEHIVTLKDSPIVVASEYENVRNLRDSFKLEIVESNRKSEIIFTNLAQRQIELSAAEAMEKTLTGRALTPVNNILEFPTRDTRRSEETS